MTHESISAGAKGFEISLIALSAALSLVCTALFFSDVSLRKVILGWEDTETLEPVGDVQKSEGGVRRKAADRNEFVSVQQKSKLFNFDTIVTGDDAKATIQLDDGSTIELGPKTMIKLAFESRLSLGGITRAARVNVVTGKVSGKAGTKSNAAPVVIQTREKTITLATPQAQETVQVNLPTPKQLMREVQEQMLKLETQTLTLPTAKTAEVVESAAPVAPEVVTAPVEPPPPPPPPVQASKQLVSLLSPKSGARLAVPDGSPRPERAVTFEWKQQPGSLLLTLRRVGAAGTPSSEPVFTRELTAPAPPEAKTGKSNPLVMASASTTLTAPGTYEWELSNLPNDPATEPFSIKRRFELARQYRGVEVLDPLVGGTKAKSNEYTGQHLKNFDITFNWKPVSGAKEYTVKMYKSANAQGAPIAEKKTSEDKFVLNREKVLTSTVYYTVTALTENGFLVTSPIESFQFNFMPPVLVFPGNGATLSAADLASEGNKLLFTWQKTNYTQAYELEISKTPDFRKTERRKKTSENFLITDPPASGRYFWRVRSLSATAKSPYTPAFEFSVGP